MKLSEDKEAGLGLPKKTGGGLSSVYAPALEATPFCKER
jgi:hypothetical protein